MDDVEASLLKAVELKPDDTGYLLVLATHYRAVGQAEKAEEWLRSGLEKESKAALWTALAKALLTDKERDVETEEALNNALELVSTPTEDGEDADGLAEAYQNLAGFYASRDREDEAVALLEKGIGKIIGDSKQGLIFTLARSVASGTPYL